MPTVALITNMPTPYRVPVLDLLAENHLFDLRVLYLTEREQNRDWVFEYERPFARVLNSKFISIGGRDIHVNIGLFQKLLKLDPSVIICTGYGPAFLVGYLFAILFKKKVIVHTDGDPLSESKLGPAHKLIRKFLKPYIDAVVCTGEKAKQMYIQNGFQESQIFVSPLSIDNSLFESSNLKLEDRDIDLLFVGRLEKIKNPEFFLRLCARIQAKFEKKLTIFVAGSGNQRLMLENLSQETEFEGVSITFTGFLQKEQVNELFGRSKVFVFPSIIEPWGLVANESCASGTPVVAIANIGAVDELLFNEHNSYILNNFDFEEWADRIISLLSSNQLWNRMSINCSKSVSNFSFQSSAAGLSEAINYALQVSVHS